MAYKMRDFKCTKCETRFEALVGENEAGMCPKCNDSEFVELAPSGFGAYHINGANSGSTRPKMAGYKPPSSSS